MKYQALFGVLFAILLAGVRSEDNWTEEEETCVNELKLDKAEILKLNNEDIAPEDNPDFNRFLACSWKKDGTLKDDGTINWDKVDDSLEEEFKKEFESEPTMVTLLSGVIIDDAVEECKKQNIKGSTDGQTVAKVLNCIMKHIKESVDSAEKN